MRTVLPFALLVSIQLTTDDPVISRPCYPTDPTGNNPQNPCLIYPPPGISSDSFVQGEARPVRELPTITRPSGQILIRPTGFWTGSETGGNSRIIRTSAGKVYQINK